MKSYTIIKDDEIQSAIKKSGFTGRSVEESRLCLLELLVKAGAGYHNGYTEETFLSYFALMKKDRTPNKKGRRFICQMTYASSNKKPTAYYSIDKFRA